MTQVEAAHLLGRHKSWVCRRLALLEKLSVAVKEDLRLGLVGPSLARQLTRLPAGNQEAVLALVRRETLTAQEVSGVIDLLQGASQEQAAFVLAKPREALAAVHGMPAALRDPRLSRAGNWLARHLTAALEGLVRVENWLRTPNERELHRQDREILQPLLARVGDQASVVAELVLGADLKRARGAMNEALRLEIVQRRQSGMSQRAIAEELGISRGAVCRALTRVQAQRDGQATPLPRAAPAWQHRRCLRADLEGTAGQISEPDRRARRARTAATRLHRRLHGGACARAAACGRGRADSRCRALRPSRRDASTNGPWRLRHRLHPRRPAARLPVQLPARLLAPAVPALGRVDGSADDLARARACLPSSGRRRPRLPVRQLQGGGALARCRRPALQPQVPRLRHALRLPPPGLPCSPAANEGQSRTTISLCRNQPAQWPHLRHAGASQRGDRAVAGTMSPMCGSCATSRNRHASGTSASSRTCCRCRPATSTRPWSSIATSTSKASSPIG